ncbi:MAG: carbon-nitrogen hydrolase family protein [Gemmatimonadaceae bacterium]|nr:carbon-nitrogen hydrolase family protein [Acetobacteraceae bacterium]
MRVTVVQMNPGADKAANLLQAEQLVDRAAVERPDLVALPEMWTCLGGDRATKLQAAEQLPPAGSGAAGGPAYEFVRRIARGRGLFVHGGSIGEHAGDGRMFNTTVVFDPRGNEVARYRKIHLFDITTPDGHGYRESASFGAGDQVVTFMAGGLRVGCAICYDLRFPELFLALRQAGAELILLPSAFTVATGRDHWDVLIRARAIETQCWMAAPATWGVHRDGAGQDRSTYGHSLVCDPWGQVVATVSDGVGWATARIDAGRTARVRRDMPVLEHRRPAIFGQRAPDGARPESGPESGPVGSEPILAALSV